MATSCPGKNFPYAKIINGKQTTPAASGTSVKSNSTKTTCTTASNNTVYTKTQFIKDVQSAIGAKTDGIAGPDGFDRSAAFDRSVFKYYKMISDATPSPIYMPFMNGFSVSGSSGGMMDDDFFCRTSI